jgi:hypothetical protein
VNDTLGVKFLYSDSTVTFNDTLYVQKIIVDSTIKISNASVYDSDVRGLFLEGTYPDAGFNHHPLRLKTIHPLTSGSVAAFDSDISTSGSGNLGHIVSFQARATHGSSGTLAQFYGDFISLINNGGVATDAYSSYILNPYGSGTITNNYGLFIDTLTKGVNNWAIYTDGATNSYFGGNIAINTAVSRNISISGAASAVIGMEIAGAEKVVFGTDGTGGFFQAKNNTPLRFWDDAGNGFQILDGGNSEFAIKIIPDADEGADIGTHALRFDETHTSKIFADTSYFISGSDTLFSPLFIISDLADDDSITLTASKNIKGEIFISGDNEASYFWVEQDGSVTLFGNKGSIVNTDTDTNLCIFPTAGAGNYAVIRNRLGSAKKLIIELTYLK